MELQVIGLTKNLLNSGAFNHLSDAELGKMQWLLHDSHPQQGTADKLMHFWYYADFFAAGVPQYLFHECNLVLQQYGKPAIDMMLGAEMEV